MRKRMEAEAIWKSGKPVIQFDRHDAHAGTRFFLRQRNYRDIAYRKVIRFRLDDLGVEDRTRMQEWLSVNKIGYVIMTQTAARIRPPKVDPYESQEVLFT